MGAELDVGARERLLDALAAGSSIARAAEAAGYSRKHAHTLLKDERFLAELARRKATIAAGPADTDVKLALETLRAITRGELEGTAGELATRVQAAKAILGHVALARKTTSAPAPPPLKLVESDGGAAARAWLERQA